MNTNPSEKKILAAVILAYRTIISDRYQYSNIRKKIDLPPSFDEARVNLFRNYFLDNIYPDSFKREELNDAFQSLDNYIRHPGKLLRLLSDSIGLLFKYGRHLPKILKAGLKAFESFRAATAFEQKLVLAAMSSSRQPPYNRDDIYTFLRALSLNDIEQFIDQNQSLFETLYDRTLVRKIKEIVEHLIDRMKKHPAVYSNAEIRGLEIGCNLIKEGDELFDQLSTSEQKQIFEFVVKMEREVLKEVYP